jgi:hypothetical protein
LLEIRALKTTRVTKEDRNAELSQQIKIYFCRRVHRHIDTASMRKRKSLLFLSLMQWVLPPYLSSNLLILHLESGGGAANNFSIKMELSEQEPGNASN